MAWHSMILITTVITWPYLVSPVPIDLYQTDTQKYILPRNQTSPGICKENINNDNITNIKWYRYHNDTHRCYHIDERGPCPQLMLFYAIGDSDYGDCDCNLYYRCARPIIYWPPHKRCYYTNDQGPCADDEWIILKDKSQPICQLNLCKHNQTEEPSTYDRYWFEENGECYKTLTKGYCKGSEEILYPKWEEYKPSCNVGRVCSMKHLRSLKDPLQCIPGQKTNMEGKCTPALSLTNLLKSMTLKK